MANSDKNIVITPNTGSSSSDPQIVFSGASSSLGPQNITLRAYPTNGGTLSFEASNGQLFSIVNTMTGSIFSVNDISGIPSIEVLDTGLVKLAEFSGNVGIGVATATSKLHVVGNTLITGITTVTNTTNATSTTTGALIVTGGVGIGGNLFVGGNLNSAGSSNINYSTTTNVNSGTYVYPRFQSYSEVVTTLASTTAAQDLNLNLSNIFDVTLTQNTTFTFRNTATTGFGMPVTVILRQGGSGSYTASFTGARYSDGVTPVLSTTVGQIDVLSFFTVNGGSFWFGTFAMANVS